MRIEKLKRNFDIVVKWVHFPLHPDTPAEGRSLEALFGGGPEGMRSKNADMKARMDAEGLAYGPRTHTYNSRLAQELGAWADTQPGGEAIHDAMYKAYFVHGCNIGDPEQLVAVARSAGLAEDAARAVVERRGFKDAVDGDWEKSRRYGVTGVPTFVCGGHGVVGAQPYEALAQLVKEAGAPLKVADAARPVP